MNKLLRVDGVRQRDLIVSRPGYPDPLTGGMRVILPPSRIQADLTCSSLTSCRDQSELETKPLNLVRMTTNYLSTRCSLILRGRNLNARR